MEVKEWPFGDAGLWRWHAESIWKISHKMGGRKPAGVLFVQPPLSQVVIGLWGEVAVLWYHSL